MTLTLTTVSTVFIYLASLLSLSPPDNQLSIEIMSTSPDLQTWAQSKITALYSAESDEDLQHAFESALSSSAQIRMNNEAMQRDDLKSDLLSRRGAAASATVEWVKHEVTAKDEQAGRFNGEFTVKRSMRYRIRAAPAQLHTNVTVTAQIEQDPDSVTNAGDTRRIVDLTLTYEDTRPPVHFQQPRATQGGEGGGDLD